MITDYGTLQDELVDYLHRTDLGSKMPTFIQMAESKLANNIRSRKMEVATDLVTTASVNYITLPTDFGALKNIQVAGSVNTVLTLLPDDTLLNYNNNNNTGTPQFYAIQGEQILLSPVPNDALTINVVYYQTLPPLSTSNPTNWILTRYPYVYLYGSLLAASVYINDPEQAQFYQMSFDGALNDMWQNYGFESFSGSPLRAVSDYIVDYIF